MYYHVDVPSPDEEDVGQDDQTEHLVPGIFRGSLNYL